jgi:high-affinity iron transporter
MTALAVASADILAAGPSVSSQLLGSGLIGLLEGLEMETGIVVMILVAFLVKAERREIAGTA